MKVRHATSIMFKQLNPKTWFPGRGIARSVLVLAGGTAMAQGLAVLAAPVLTRIYKPSDFGVLQIFISILGLGLVACSGRYEVAILLPDDEQSATDILAVALLCVCVIHTHCERLSSWDSLASPPISESPDYREVSVDSSVESLRGWDLPGVKLLGNSAWPISPTSFYEGSAGRGSGRNPTRRRPFCTRPLCVAVR